MKFVSSLMLATLLVACSKPSSDEEKVRAVFAAAETAAEDRDASDVLALVATDYADRQGFDKTQLGHFLRGYFFTHPKLELAVSVDDVQFPADGLARARVTVTSLDLTDPQREHLDVELRRDGGDWRVARADRADR